MRPPPKHTANWGHIESVQAVIEAAHVRLALPLFASEVFDIRRGLVKRYVRVRHLASDGFQAVRLSNH